MKRNIILSFILVAFIAALCVTVMSMDDYYLSSADKMGAAGTKQEETVTMLNPDSTDDNNIELAKMNNY